jgi:hypothetical protein
MSIFRTYIERASASGKMWGLTLYPVVKDKEKLHALLLCQRLHTCAAFKELSDSTPHDQFVAMLDVLLLQYEDRLKKNLTNNPYVNSEASVALLALIPDLHSQAPIYRSTSGIGSLTSLPSHMSDTSKHGGCKDGGSDVNSMFD